MPEIIPAQRVSWLELFYDVIIAASMLLIYGSLAKHLSWNEFLWLSTVALVVFSIWLSTTLLFNRVAGDSLIRRLAVLAQMIALIYAVASMESSSRVDGDIGVIALGVTMLILAALWEYVRRSDGENSRTDRLPVVFFVIGSVFLLSAAFLPDTWTSLVFVIGALIGFVPIFIMYVPRIYVAGIIDMHHLVERLGGLVLIMLGETLLEMAVLFTKGADPRAFGVVLVLVLLMLIWWQYFTFVSAPPRAGGTSGHVIAYLLGHALLVIGLGTAALALTEVGLALTEQLSLPVLAGILGGAMTLIYAGMAIILMTTKSGGARAVIMALAAVVFGILGLLFWSAWEIDEQQLTLVIVGVSLLALLASGAVSKKGSNRAIHA